MDQRVTCEHLNHIAKFGKKELWQMSESPKCVDCQCPGPNLWVCLQPECDHIGCSENKNDHSTIHQKLFPEHCVHINISTNRIWCYLCEKEVHMTAALPQDMMTPDSTTETGTNLRWAPYSDNEEDPNSIDYDSDENTLGLVGLQNIGNTCYMNAALQALSNSPPFTAFFLECGPLITLLTADKKPGLSRAYQKLISEMWSNDTRGYAVPSGILHGIRNVHPMFKGYQQHDAQEFLRCFLDQLHEELKEPVYEPLPEDNFASDADGDTGAIFVRRRAVSSGATDAPYFARMRRKSITNSCYSEARADGYRRMQTVEGGSGGGHRRSASFGGNMQTNISQSDLPDSGAMSSESSLSTSTDADERYETCSSGDDDPTDDVSADGTSTPDKYRSVVSDVFDGRLLSSVQCLVCNRVSTRVETFQDLSLPIPSKEHLAALRSQQAVAANSSSPNESWLWWLVGWLRSWFFGPAVTLQDCLATFFSADELKGDNMYSCSRCNKLRNGIKMSRVVRLPEVLCVHLKRFRHDLTSSAKLAARVAFPIHRLDMAPYMHSDCKTDVTSYELSAVIVHAGSAVGGHYTCVARTARGWHAFDDRAVRPLPPDQFARCEAYVLFYRKLNIHMNAIKKKATEILESASMQEVNDDLYYISKQWITKFNTWAEPGPVDNADFACAHGAARPERAPHAHALAVRVPGALWRYARGVFGGGPACVRLDACRACAARRCRDAARARLELETFCRLHTLAQERSWRGPVYAVSMQWFRRWQAFVRERQPRPPPALDNADIALHQVVNGKSVYTLKLGSDYGQLTEELWKFFTSIYGGGPEIKLRTAQDQESSIDSLCSSAAMNRRFSRKYTESDKEDYCTKSTSETNLRQSTYGVLHKNQSLQNINKHCKYQSTDESEDEVYRANAQLRTEQNVNSRSDSESRIEDGVVNGFGDSSRKNPACDDETPDKAVKIEMSSFDNVPTKVKAKQSRFRKQKRRGDK